MVSIKHEYIGFALQRWAWIWFFVNEPCFLNSLNNIILVSGTNWSLSMLMSNFPFVPLAQIPPLLAFLRKKLLHFGLIEK